MVTNNNALIKLISPDDGTLLRQTDEYLIDESGNRYFFLDGIPDLRPKKSLEVTMTHKLIDHQFFRSYKYKRFLTPLFLNNHCKHQGVKEGNIRGFVPPPKDKDMAICLDHGCGSGHLRSFMESFGYMYIGVDNENGVSAEQGGGKRFKGGATHICDLHRLPFKDNTFQFAVSYSVFEHLQNPFVAAAELFRVMRPDSVCFMVVAGIVPFHMDSFYHHTHYGVLNTFNSVGFEVNQVAGGNWNAYKAISAMDGMPGPKWVRKTISELAYQTHLMLWKIRTLVKGRDHDTEDLRRHLMMAGIMKAILIKP